MLPWRSNLSFTVPDGGNFTLLFEGTGGFNVGNVFQFLPFLGTSQLDLATISETDYCVLWASNLNWFLPDGATICAWSMPQFNGEENNSFDFRFRESGNVAAQWRLFPDAIKFNGITIVDPAHPPYSASNPPPATQLCGHVETDSNGDATVADARILATSSAVLSSRLGVGSGLSYDISEGVLTVSTYSADTVDYIITF